MPTSRSELQNTIKDLEETVEQVAEYVSAAVEHERGTHDAGGLVIHETPKEKRQAFAKEIWRRRRRRGR